LKFSPRDVVFAGWVGDQTPTFYGLIAALKNIMYSAWADYVNFGSDIGGYLSGSGERNKTVFIRWAQLGAFLPVMENGGNKEHRPWKFDNNNETLDIYRKFVHIHTELSPYFLSAGTEAFEKGTSVLFPNENRFAISIKDFGYRLYEDIFVTPVTSENNNLQVNFPGTNKEQWVDWWDHTRIYNAKVKVNYQTTLANFPVFKRKGSIIPLRVISTFTGNGDESSKDSYTLLITRPTEGEQIKNIYEDHGTGIIVRYERKNDKMQVVVTSHPSHKIIILLRGIQSFKEIVNEIKEQPIENVSGSLRNLEKIGAGYYLNQKNGDIYIRTGDLAHGAFVTIHGIVDAPKTII